MWGWNEKEKQSVHLGLWLIKRKPSSIGKYKSESYGVKEHQEEV